MDILFEMVVILVLILANGVFAMAEIAVVSAATCGTRRRLIAATGRLRRCSNRDTACRRASFPSVRPFAANGQRAYVCESASRAKRLSLLRRAAGLLGCARRAARGGRLDRRLPWRGRLRRLARLGSLAGLDRLTGIRVR